MHWIASTLCKVCIHSWHALVALDFFVDLMFIQIRKSKKKILTTHQEHLQLSQGWGIFCYFLPRMVVICRSLHAIKTNPHLYPGVGMVGVYFDWCIKMTARLALKCIVKNDSSKNFSSLTT